MKITNFFVSPLTVLMQLYIQTALFRNHHKYTTVHMNSFRIMTDNIIPQNIDLSPQSPSFYA